MIKGSKTKLIAVNFLHQHKLQQGSKNVDSDHVIVDKEDWEEVVWFFKNNPDVWDAFVTKKSRITLDELAKKSSSNEALNIFPAGSNIRLRVDKQKIQIEGFYLNFPTDAKEHDVTVTFKPVVEPEFEIDGVLTPHGKKLLEEICEKINKAVGFKLATPKDNCVWFEGFDKPASVDKAQNQEQIELVTTVVDLQPNLNLDKLFRKVGTMAYELNDDLVMSAGLAIQAKATIERYYAQALFEYVVEKANAIGSDSVVIVHPDDYISIQRHLSEYHKVDFGTDKFNFLTLAQSAAVEKGKPIVR